jgi:hypothetical protein
MKTVYSAANIALVSIFQNILEEQGIKCWVKNEFLLAGIDEIPPIECWPQLCVENSDFLEAKRIVDEALSAKDMAKARKCGSCGEEIEGQFTECWNCFQIKMPDNTPAVQTASPKNVVWPIRDIVLGICRQCYVGSIESGSSSTNSKES